MSIRTAISGLNAAQTDLATTANNIANASTTGFKGARAEFADLFSAGAAGLEPGTGVRVSGVVQNFAQGDLAATGRDLDLGINGNGFFVVQTKEGTPAYTRSGAFQLDRDGFLANGAGDRLQTYKFDQGRFETGVPSTLKVPLTSDAKATTEVDFGFNLPALSAEAPGPAFDPKDPKTYNFTTATTVYDSQGGAHVATLYLRKDSTSTNSWRQYLYIDGNGVNRDGTANPTGTPPSPPDPVNVRFDKDGRLLGVGPAPTPPVKEVTTVKYTALALTNSGAKDLQLTLDVANATQIGSAFNVTSVSQDGFSSGSFINLSVDNQGVIRGAYTNGQQNEIGKVALANFAVPQALVSRGAAAWTETAASGAAVYGSAAAGGFGDIRSGTLESSNVDITEQLVNMITAQRNFQANAKVVSTADQLAQSIINLR
jgi:flagellar hook protein FlgE